MICQNDNHLTQLVNKAKTLTKNGKVADYIPALAEANKADLSIAIYSVEGACLKAGEVQTTFTLQSISKVLSLALVLMDHGQEYVFNRVGMEPTGDPFNSIAKLETIKPSKPLNPMINAGALAVTNMIKGKTKDEKIERLLAFIQTLTNNSSVSVCERVARSEFNHAWLNRSMCYFLKEHGIIEGDVEALMEVYTKQCAIEMNCYDLAKIGAVLALNGVHPDTKEQVIPERIARLCKTFMVTCGMYNASGEFAIKVGIPAKSGVAGGILAIVPNKYGIGVYGPALDERGNSIAGCKLLEMISEEHSLSIF
ncbi:glutaminase A [Bacillus kexueae]|uniref:glutaminase A n=1 Tax=Aeribacillus kexueae TaxID=2078952 RepID=UPI001FAFDF4A|nr:glutaminase A [Bacillus kexueae]